jgi:uncharacterized membrane protein YGL010W
MKTLADWLDEYGESHRHPVNKTVHWICVPLITFSVLGMLWALHPGAALVLVGAATVFYLRLSVAHAIGMLAVSTLMLGVIRLLPHPFATALAVFVAAWVGQFWGHHVEGRKPSFFKDIQFLLIGPVWLLDSVYRRLGIAA